MLRNAKNNGFIFRFPKDFFIEPVNVKFSHTLKHLPTVYKDINALVNSSIQSITFPGFRIEIPTQVQKGYTVPHRSGYDSHVNINRDFNVTFKLVEGYLNYWIMYFQLADYTEYIRQEKDVKKLPDFNIMYLNDHGNILVSQRLQYVQMTGIDDLTPSYADPGNEPKTFTCTFKFGYIDVDIHPTSNGQPIQPENFFIEE